MSHYNSSGAGEAPRLGRGKPEGLASPGKGQSLGGSDSASIPKVARPGGAQSLGSSDSGSPLKAARPGGPEQIST